ncbi:MAG: hypothetical protein CVU51_04305 [Deltaproteobacteria bacterium HGW-Deltaproteobacteria-1]|nr:MAG: hypothetical protein CVU51_04305 [Deltaproteobacteria bacterium HGW-Deltaproteobacteria-1]
MPFFTADDGVRLHYQTSGAGKPVLFIHGLTASSLFFRKQIPELAGRFQVIAPDLRGHGLSEAATDHLTIRRLAEDLRQLIDHLNLSEISLIGWSMGAHVIFEYIKNYSCAGIEKILIIEKKNNASVIAAFWIAMAVQDYRPVLKSISVPCLLVYGTESNYYPAANYDYMQKQIPDARVAAFEGCGHALHIQDPELFNRMAMDFLLTGFSACEGQQDASEPEGDG